MVRTRSKVLTRSGRTEQSGFALKVEKRTRSKIIPKCRSAAKTGGALDVKKGTCSKVVPRSSSIEDVPVPSTVPSKAVFDAEQRNRLVRVMEEGVFKSLYQLHGGNLDKITRAMFVEPRREQFGRIRTLASELAEEIVMDDMVQQQAGAASERAVAVSSKIAKCPESTSYAHRELLEAQIASSCCSPHGMKSICFQKASLYFEGTSSAHTETLCSDTSNDDNDHHNNNAAASLLMLDALCSGQTSSLNCEPHLLNCLIQFESYKPISVAENFLRLVVTASARPVEFLASPLVIAALLGYSNSVVNLLLNTVHSEADLSLEAMVVGDDGKIERVDLLSCAVFLSNNELLKICAPSCNRKTALRIAEITRNVGAIDHLIRNFPVERDMVDVKVLSSSSQGNASIQDLFLVAVASQGHVNTVQLLYEKGAVINLMEFMAALHAGCDETVFFLLSHCSFSDGFLSKVFLDCCNRQELFSCAQRMVKFDRANYNARFRDGLTTLMFVAREKRTDLLKLILSCAKHDTDFINCALPESNKTALHFAVESNYAEGVRLLCEAGADVKLPDSSGLCTMDLIFTPHLWSDSEFQRKILPTFLEACVLRNEQLTQKTASENIDD